MKRVEDIKIRRVIGIANMRKVKSQSDKLQRVTQVSSILYCKNVISHLLGRSFRIGQPTFGGCRVGKQKRKEGEIGQD